MTYLSAVSFDSAFENAQSDVLNNTPISTTTGTEQAQQPSGPSSTLVFAGVSYWTLLIILGAIAIALFGTKMFLKHHFYSKK